MKPLEFVFVDLFIVRGILNFFMELVLDRRLADRRTFPAIDLIKSGTRKEELLYHPTELEKVYILRQSVADLSPIDAMNLLLARLKKTNSNTEFLLSMKD